MKFNVLIGLIIVLALVASSAAVRAQEATPAGKALEDASYQLKSMMNQVPPERFLSESQRLLGGVIEKYPKSPEADQAMLLLGQIYTRFGDNGNSIKYMKMYLNSPNSKKSAEQVAYVKYFIGMGYIKGEKFEEARKYLVDVVNAATVTDNRVKQSAQMQLNRIETLKKLRLGQPAIDFSATTADGKKIKLSDFRGKVVLLDFWATWCAPCRQEIPNVKKVFEEFHKKGFEIIGISLDQKKVQFDSYMESNNISWPQIFDGKGWKSDIGSLYAVTSIPATFLLDRKGVIRYKNVRGPDLRKAVRQLIGE